MARPKRQFTEKVKPKLFAWGCFECGKVEIESVLNNRWYCSKCKRWMFWQEVEKFEA